MKLATDTEDGHYKEVGTTGSLSNKIQFYRTEADGSWTLDEDVILTAIVRRSVSRRKRGAGIMAKTYEEKLQDTGWKNVSMNKGYTSSENLPMQYRIKNKVLYLQGVIITEDVFPSSNTYVFKVPNIELQRNCFVHAEISGSEYSMTQARRTS